MRTLSRWLAIGVVLVCICSVSSFALARGGGRGFGARGFGARGARGGAGAGDLCSSWSTFNVSLSTLDIMIGLNDAQKAALDQLKRVAAQNAAAMTTVCAQDPTTLGGEAKAAEKHLEAALAGVRRAEPVAARFCATLSDAQRAQLTDLLDWPGL